jgi:hypothetical protein
MVGSPVICFQAIEPAQLQSDITRTVTVDLVAPWRRIDR